MTSIVSQFSSGPTLSVELWPPRTPEAEARLSDALQRFERLALSFASITYGAAGSTRERTHELVVKLQRDHSTTPMAHLVTAAHERRELVEILERYRDEGVTNILALRGDSPIASRQPLRAGELEHAIELVELAKSLGPFCVAVAAHPGGHPESLDLATDRRFLAAKLDVADFAITQFFFRVEEYAELVEDLSARGVDKPVVPGIMPVTSSRSLTRMAELSGRAVPRELVRRVESLGDDQVAIADLGVELATELCEKLMSEGAPGLHFYTMNQVQATIRVCENLGFGLAG